MLDVLQTWDKGHGYFEGLGGKSRASELLERFQPAEGSRELAGGRRGVAAAEDALLSE